MPRRLAEGDRSATRFDQFPHQPKTDPAGLRSGRQSRSGVAHRQHGAAAASRIEAHLDHPAGRGVADRVGEEVDQDLHERPAIDRQTRGRGGKDGSHRHGRRLGLPRHEPERPADRLGRIALFRVSATGPARRCVRSPASMASVRASIWRPASSMISAQAA